MAWLTDAEFRTFHVTESATAIDSAITTECLDTAISEIIVVVGVSIDAEIEAASNADRKTQIFRRAQRKLAYRELLQFMSSRSRDGGIVETEKDANGDTTNKYISRADVEKLRQVLKSEAFEILTPYFTPEETEIVNNRRLSSSAPIAVDWFN